MTITTRAASSAGNARRRRKAILRRKWVVELREKWDAIREQEASS